MGDQPVEICLSLCSSLAHCPYSFFFFLPKISSLCTRWTRSSPRLTICLDHCQVKSWCLSSRDAATIIAGSLTCHTCLEKKVGLRSGGVGGVSGHGGGGSILHACPTVWVSKNFLSTHLRTLAMVSLFLKRLKRAV